MSNGFSLLEASKRPHHFKQALCNAVMQEVEEAFGHRISTSGDCIRLSDEVYLKTSVKLNPNTLRRFFGLVKAQYPPSTSTLTVLANYCGYQSLEELEAVKSQSPSEQQSCNEKILLRYLTQLFHAVPVRGSLDEAGYAFIKYTIQFLSQCPPLIDGFQKAIAKTKHGQAYYFEQFVNIDSLHSFYGEGLRYYIREKSSVEGQVFGYSLLCLRDWLLMDHERLEKHFDRIRNISKAGLSDPYIYGHYIAAQLLHAEAFKLDRNAILEEAYKIHLTLKRASHQPYLFKSFEYTLAFVLVLVQNQPDALYYINEASLMYPAVSNPIDKKCQIRLRLFRALAFAQSNMLDEAAAILAQVHPSQFCFLSRKTDMILYLTLTCTLRRGNIKLEKQLCDLIETTGLLKLKKLLANDILKGTVEAVCEQK